MSDTAPSPDTEAGCLHPRETRNLLGHDEAWQQFISAAQSGKLHHAWMITGPKGVGKASFAYQAAAYLLSQGAGDADQMIAAQSHPNLLVINRPWDEKRKRYRAEITIDEIRRVPDFFSKSAGQPGWRIAIIDSMDEFNRNAANGLLKTLEEPPERGLLFLVSSVPGRLVPTIRSRCRRLDLRAPLPEITSNWLKDTHHLSEDIAETAAILADGAPGRALVLAKSGAIEIEKDVRTIFSQLPRLDKSSVRRLATRISQKSGEILRPHLFESLARNLSQEASKSAANDYDTEPWISAWRDVRMLAQETDGIYLDPKQSILTAFSLIESAARKVAVTTK